MRKTVLVNIVTGAVVLLVLGIVGSQYLSSHKSGAHTRTCSTTTPLPVVIAFGDSLIEGYGAPEQHGFVGPLSDKLGIPIINNGVSGDTTAQGLARVQAVLDEHPNIVILLFGGNDALQKVPLATTKANLTQILTQLTDQHIRVVLLGVLGGFPSDPYASMFRDLSNQFHTTYVPNVLSGLITNSKLMYDQVHPNAEGYDLIANKVYPVVKGECS